MKAMLATIDPAKFAMLVDVGNLINSDYADSKILIGRIIDSSARLVGAEAASLVLVDKVSRSLRFEVATGPRKDELSGQEIGPEEGIVGWVAANGRALIVRDPRNDPRFSISMAERLEYPCNSILAVPMKIRDSVVGVIEAIRSRDQRQFTEEDLAWLSVFATQAAIALQNSRYLEQASAELSYLGKKAVESQGYHELVFESRAMAEKTDLVDRIAPTDATVLILGESGVGKELFAERIHRASKRNGKALVRVNCAALPEALLESELFGHVRGAFTDAVQDRKGRFEIADGGTLFLDEIGELPLRLQAKLLRVLQAKSFEKVGSSDTLTVDVRIIAASNRDLGAMVEAQEFRADLYYRLNVLPVIIPPLRERKEDIPPLARHFMKQYARETSKAVDAISDSAMRTLLTYAWPGNVRELANCMERAVVLAGSHTVGAKDLMLAGAIDCGEDYGTQNLKSAVNLFKKQYIRSTLEKNGWNQTATAKELEIQRTYLSRLIKELSIAQSKE